MGKVYSPPAKISEPKMESFRKQNLGLDFRAYEEAEFKFVEEVKEWCKSSGSGKYAGEEVHFPQGDGHARYVVFSTKPLTLIHLPVGDAWQYPYIERLTAKDIVARIESGKNLTRLFAREVSS